MNYTDFEGTQEVSAEDICPICFGAGGAINSGYDVNEPCHGGPYFPYHVGTGLYWHDGLAAVVCNRCNQVISTDQAYYQLDPNAWLNCDCTATFHCGQCDQPINEYPCLYCGQEE